jgi:hypothetical protein
MFSTNNSVGHTQLTFFLIYQHLLSLVFQFNHCHPLPQHLGGSKVWISLCVLCQGAITISIHERWPSSLAWPRDRICTMFEAGLQ